MKLLHIDASILGDGSVSRKLSAAIVDRLRQVHPGIAVIYRDLAATPLSHISTADLVDPNPVLDEFLAADIVVIGAPMYNFTVPESPAAAMEHVESYLRSVFAFMSITDPKIIVAEGIMVGPELRDNAVNAALASVANLAVAQAA